MQRLNTKASGFAVGGGLALLYLASVFVIHTLPRHVAIYFLNSIVHGIDVTPILRWEMPWWEMVVGVLHVFILGWLFGSALAILWPFVIGMHYRLAQLEEQHASVKFGQKYREYRQRTPMFFPRLSQLFSRRTMYRGGAILTRKPWVRGRGKRWINSYYMAGVLQRRDSKLVRFFREHSKNMDVS
jgi:protein-S-isoprenylcysteine O-methyltransferase Ste14